MPSRAFEDYAAAGFNFIAQVELDVDRRRNSDAHYFPQHTVVGLDFDQALVNSQFPSFVSVGTVPARSLASGDFQFLRGQRNRSSQFNASLLRNISDLRADRIQVLEDMAFEFDSGFVHAKPTFFFKHKRKKKREGFRNATPKPALFFH